MAIALAAGTMVTLEAAGLRGRVLDVQGAVVPTVTLRLQERNGGSERSTLSRSDGTYQFSNLSPGSYLLEGQTEDSLLSGSTIIVIERDSVQDLELGVAPSSIQVVVTASSTPLEQQETARALDAVDAKEIARRGEMTVAEALRTLPGVRVQQLRGPGSFVTVQSRGMRAQDTALLIDGIRFRDAASIQGGATAFYQDLAIVDLEQVELLRGTGSSLYGSHAMGGVINVRSRRGGGEPHGEIRAEGGGLGLLRGVARAGGGLGDDRFQYSGGLSHLNVTRGHRNASPYRNSSAQGSARFVPIPTVSISGRVWGSDSFRTLIESPSFPAAVVANFPTTGNVPARALPETQLARLERGEPYEAGSATFVPDQIDSDSRNASSFLAAALVLRQELSPGNSYQVSFQSIESARRYQDGPAGAGAFEPPVSNDSRYDGQIRTLVARTDHRIGAAHLASIGFEFESERYTNFNTDESPSPLENSTEIDQANYALFAQDQVRALGGSLHINLSGRVQHFIQGSPLYSGTSGPYGAEPPEEAGRGYVGDASVAYFVKSSGTKLRAHVGNGFRAPSLYERFGGSFSSYSGTFNFWGDPRLKPERSMATDFGIDQWLAGSSARLSASYFYTDLSEIIFFDFANFPANDPFGRFGGYRNSSGGIARGVEISGQVSPRSGTSVSGSYTFTNAESRTPTIGTSYYQIPGNSSHLYTATASQWIGRRFSLAFDLFGASDYVLSPWGAQGRRVVFGGPLKADLVGRYEHPVGESKHLEFYGKAENVFNHDYFEDGFASPGVWVIAGIRYRF